jgi:hypothetical protein
MVTTMNKITWTTVKPVLDQECMLMTASKIGNQYDYKLWLILKVSISLEEGWYFGLHCEDGEEWGDYADLHGDFYATFPLIPEL